MAIKKRHHYIPRFYLKRFSINNEGKFIGLFNHKSNIFVPQAPLKHQAYQNFLYGNDDEIEDALAKMENDVARMFYYWTEEKLLYPPPIESNGYRVLRQFILYQANRTPKSGNELMQYLDEAFKVVLKELDQDLWKAVGDFSLSHETPVLLNLFNSVIHENLLDYLDCRFIVNLSDLPFITSDSPVILYNQFMEAAGNYIGATGLVAKGLQVFYPIHPRLMICLYDSAVYNLGDGCQNCCSIESVIEVHQLNALQYINSESQIFFDELISVEYIQELCREYKDYRMLSRNINTIIKGGSKKFLFTGTEDAHINLELTPFKMLLDPKDYKDEVVPLRHPSFDRPLSNK